MPPAPNQFAQGGQGVGSQRGAIPTQRLGMETIVPLPAIELEAEVVVYYLEALLIRENSLGHDRCHESYLLFIF